MKITITPTKENIGGWDPVTGPTTEHFIRMRTETDKLIDMRPILNEARSILSHCVRPTQDSGNAVVLAIGNVQSGKTLSFTTLAALARDNDFGVVILLAGTTNNLKDQSQVRLERDLGLDELQRVWTQIFENPEVGGPALPQMRKALRGWRRRRERKTQEDKPALIMSVLKHAGRIKNAAAALSTLDLNGVPALIIDDESDQATPNTKAKTNRTSGGSDESPTYSAVNELRDALPHHSLVQYTATPQANLLLATADRLNPHYAKVLSSGHSYTGGKVYFQERADLVVTLPETEIYDNKNPLTEPPEGLQEALRVFLLGIADANLKDVEENRSMMVQAHQHTGPHSVYRTWINALLRDWQTGLEAGGEYAAEVEAEFRPAYEELSRTVGDIEPFQDLLKNIPERTEELRVVEVNSTAQAEKQMRWKSAHYWLLIGGMKLDRGFTVEGLTVTYMPRPLSESADVLQQRARFFGYRGRYLNYCRVYLLDTVKRALVDYVDDEEFLRSSLMKHEGMPLSAWKRDFILHEQFRHPTRTNVIGRPTARRRSRREWSWPKSMHLSREVQESNRLLFREALERDRDKLVDAGERLPDAVDRRRSAKRNLVRSGTSLDDAVDFLMRVRLATSEDSLLMAALTTQLAQLSRNAVKTEPCSAAFVYMGELEVPEGRGRQLRVVRETIHVGMNPVGAKGEDVIYSGDDTFKVPNELTIQLRTIRLNDDELDDGDYSAVPWLAFSLPSGMSHDLILDLG